MSLLAAPEYNEGLEKLKRNLFIGTVTGILSLALLSFVGFALGHGWLFSNLPIEHKVNNFFVALEAKDYQKAYDIYTNGHPNSGYPLQRFTEDWTTESPIGAPILSHHVDISKTDGSGTFGSGVIVAVHVNSSHKLFMFYDRKDGTLTEPAPHILQY
ncbi:hypothetical protein SAMN05421770_10760 [Granulicella rosea]|uniref:Uncharacterized protein n=1 Tax=Granulicella rosea TaxID=474952 RepID=A0A239LJ72_9BACT|nr:hypothetical protein [Granulicella rosea]SNT30330.1 hypothetical protein SAMN05421770_10760 [Granulicella rosea]